MSLAFRGESRLTIKERLINILANNGFHVDHIWVQHGDYRKARWDLAVWGADHVEFKGRSVSICSWSTMTEIVKAGGITWDQGPMHTSAGNQSNDIEIYPQAMKTAADLARAAREHTQDERLKPKPWVPENEVGCGGPMSEPKQDELVAACREWQKEVLDGPNKIPGWSIQLPEKLAAFVASRIAQARLDQHAKDCSLCRHNSTTGCDICDLKGKTMCVVRTELELAVRQLAEHVRDSKKG